jgi:steroid 5-alpha reductase family enzyme
MSPLLGWAVLSGVFTLLWIRQVRTRNATSVDAAWSCSIAALALAYAITATDAEMRTRVLVATLAGVWGLRLAWHLWWHRVRKDDHEDGRYAAMRDTWGGRAQLGFFVTYQVQAGLAVLFSLPAWGVLHHAAAPAPLAILAVAIWITSLTGETIADNQLAAWRGKPENRGVTCRSGLWRYSRHPNYFFEWLQWWAYVLLAPMSICAWIGPPLMLLFLFRLTGIPWTEAQALKSRGEDYRNYQRDVSVFFPTTPKGQSSRVLASGKSKS